MVKNENGKKKHTVLWAIGIFIACIVLLRACGSCIVVSDSKESTSSAEESTTVSQASTNVSQESTSEITQETIFETSTETILETTTEVTTEAVQERIYEASTYKIGSDMPAGEYILFSEAFTSGYFQISSNSSGDFDSIIANDNFDTNSIVTLQDGQYFNMKRCYAVPIEDNPEVNIAGEGMFKVGLHIPAGEYKLTVSEDATGSGYLEVSSNSMHDLSSIITNDNFEGSTYITVSDGQYLKLNRCYIEQ